MMEDVQNIEDRYLGDGVYASCDGYSIVLDLRAQDSFTRIVLEPPVIEALIKYRNDAIEHYTDYYKKQEKKKNDHETN